ncbi:hypothetical protein [Cellulomonas aerilata]|uniref:Uncharacterized protein n=1 Tax=Cellulomonas aerilata TaxID=515326 RepID=A0A512DE52_9CELL|nr:hypothetical protein [Cellulomonas aerilata]GEO34741.1 hypothetical protein CAE01nite_24660 [Cellulomonas aerilata]
MGGGPGRRQAGGQGGGHGGGQGGGLGRLQATTVAHRLLRLLGSGPGDDGRAVRVAGPAASPRVPEPVVLPDPLLQDALLGDALPPDAPLLDTRLLDVLPPDVLHRAWLASRSWDAVAGLAEVWGALGAPERDAVARPLGHGHAGPLRLGGHAARQTDATTCGSAVLTMLAAAGDPFLALWLVTGRLVPDGSGGHHRPPELRGAGPADLAHLAPATPVDRFGAVQRAVKHASTRGALGPLPWPGALGTPPWTAARTARYPGAAYASVLVDDTDTGHLTAVLDRVDAALARGFPVPLYTGGDLSRGVVTAVPRHVVLLVPPGADGPPGGSPGARPATSTGARAYAVYEPAGGRVHRLTRAEVLAPAGPRAALGGWSHVCWAVLPAHGGPVTG